MAKSHYTVGLDIGSATIRAVVAELPYDDGPLKVIGVGTAPSVGIRRGIVVQPEEVAKSINAALEAAERMAGTAVDAVACSVSGADLFASSAIGVIAVGKADGEVTEDDLSRIIEETQARTVLGPNKEILHVVPQHYRLDDQGGIKDPVGLRGVRLELSSLVIGTGSNHLKNLIRSLELSGISARHFIAEPLASAEAILSAKQKELGVVIVNIGANTTSLAIFEDGDLLHLAVLPVGGSHITSDIAIGLRTSIDVAEAVKLQYGHAIPSEISKKESIPLSEFDSQENDEISRHHVSEIIEARLEEIFHYVNLELKSINREALLPAGVVLTGGGVLVPGAVELAKRTLRLPAQIGYPKPLGGILDHVDGPASATVVGLLLLSAEENDMNDRFSFGAASQLLNKLPGDWSSTFSRAKGVFRRFLP
ncbi:MAG: cell division protein FtsA [Candidatus Moraniibacteriota bacterium]|nr:MAG: cell division protein FtsA [Candidatus Moranbacteria bacterium]